ncbi:hypothetical protein J3E72DRAFT_239970 [Bipolaris maydis]|nr:hypothetical protein J3E72DRAFT_239970 [Bipolaris maydis]KAJ6283469.1 hypothetical protein J3E71DRAFT_352103 [Bipolaris maydis]
MRVIGIRIDRGDSLFYPATFVTYLARVLSLRWPLFSRFLSKHRYLGACGGLGVMI